MVSLKFLQHHKHYYSKKIDIYAIVKNNVFVAEICKYALYESSEWLFCAPQKPANFCHPGVCNCIRTTIGEEKRGVVGYQQVAAAVKLSAHLSPLHFDKHYIWMK